MGLIRVFVLAVVLLFTLTGRAWAAHTPEADTFLWRVAKPGEPVSYLLGTIHVGPPKGALKRQYRDVLQQVNTLYTEADVSLVGDDFSTLSNEQRQTLRLITSSIALRESLGAKRLAAVNQYLKRCHQSAYTGDEPLQLWAIAMDLSETCSSNFAFGKGVDVLLTQAARRAHKAQGFLEANETLITMNHVDKGHLLAVIDATLLHPQSARQENAQMLQRYQSNRARALMQLLDNDDTLYQGLSAQERQWWKQFLNEDLIAQRNRIWLPKITAQLPKEQTLFAVGVAHLFGANGLIALLRREGYAVTPVLPNPPIQ